jgi:2-polyprenyl-3-methyl-5-hydroxy-6-metoxy-1,4-benzoquinol methylase
VTGPRDHVSCVICATALEIKPTVRLRAARLNACPRCGTLHYSPRATAAEQVDRHSTSEYLAQPYFRNRHAQQGRARRRCEAIFREVGAALNGASLEGKPVLDIGCGTGEFLGAARDLFGVRPVGVDVSPLAVKQLRERGVEGWVGTLAELPGDIANLPVIVAIDLIEHLVDPVAFLGDVAMRLRPGGAAYFETPNPRSAVFRLGAALSRLTSGRPRVVLERLFPSEHQFYFTPAALSGAAARAGLQMVRVFTRRMPLADAAVSPALKLAVAVGQTIDRTTGDRLLSCALVKKPVAPPRRTHQ